MARLIDADALKEKAFGKRGGLIHTSDLDAMPTIEPKSGKWIVFSSPDEYHCGLVKCPFCSEELIAEANEYNYCPNCGARMENADDRN